MRSLSRRGAYGIVVELMIQLGLKMSSKCKKLVLRTACESLLIEWNMHEAYGIRTADTYSVTELPTDHQRLSVCLSHTPFIQPSLPCGGAVTNRERPLGHALYFKAPNATSEEGTEGGEGTLGIPRRRGPQCDRHGKGVVPKGTTLLIC